MDEIGKKLSTFSTVHHVGILVWDVDKAIKFYKSLGIGPFTASVRHYKERSLRGRPMRLEADVEEISARVGPMFLVLMGPIKGKKSFYTDLLETRGEGVHHIAFQVDDIDREQAELEHIGLKVLYSARYNGGGGAIYFETDKMGGTILELFQAAPDQPYLALR